MVEALWRFLSPPDADPSDPRVSFTTPVAWTVAVSPLAMACGMQPQRRCETWQCLIPGGQRIVPTSVYFTNMLQWLEHAAIKEGHDILVESQLCWGYVIHMSREHSPTTWGWTWVMSDLGVSFPIQIRVLHICTCIYIYTHYNCDRNQCQEYTYIYINKYCCTILYKIFVYIYIHMCISMSRTIHVYIYIIICLEHFYR